MNSKGFSLLEIILAMGIIAILSAAVLVGVSSQKQRAERSKVLTELSGVVQPFMLCRSDNGSISAPEGSVCSISPEYGSWPDLPGDWSYGSYDYGSSWYFSVASVEQGVTICCNRAASSCFETTQSCSASLTP